MEADQGWRDLWNSDEFRLVVECCAASFGAAGRSPAPPRLSNINWSRFLRLARFHRVEGLAWNHLATEGRVPPSAAQALKDRAVAIAAENLRAAAESGLLLSRFKAGGVPLLFLKGLTLGALAYGTPAIKSAIDIDLLIDGQDIDQASLLLRECGYELVTPSSTGRLLAWHRIRKESLWAKTSSPVLVDLHTRTADNPRLIPTITVHSPTQEVEVAPATRLPTLAADELFAYLAVHGASSVWFRLKWIADFAALAERMDPELLDRSFRRSLELGAGRAAGQALLLADSLFDTLADGAALRRQLLEDRPTKLLFQAALRQLSGPPVEPTERRLGTFAMHWTQFLMLRRFSYKLSELVGQAARAVAR